MLVIQWLSDHKLLNKCAAGKLWWKLEASREWDLGLWYMGCQACDEGFINFCRFCLSYALHMWPASLFLWVAAMLTELFKMVSRGNIIFKGRTAVCVSDWLLKRFPPPPTLRYVSVKMSSGYALICNKGNPLKQSWSCACSRLSLLRVVNQSSGCATVLPKNNNTYFPNHLYFHAREEGNNQIS